MPALLVFSDCTANQPGPKQKHALNKFASDCILEKVTVQIKEYHKNHTL